MIHRNISQNHNKCLIYEYSAENGRKPTGFTFTSTAAGATENCDGMILDQYSDLYYSVAEATPIFETSTSSGLNMDFDYF